MENLFEQLEEQCKHFDWTYPFSDDHRYWVAGEKAKAVLSALIQQCEKIDPKKTKEIVLKYQHKYGISFYK
jgi:hypothetical protein